MKTMILAALAALSIGVGAASAQTLTHGQPQSGNQYYWLHGGGG